MIFNITSNTKIKSDISDKPVVHAVKMLERDMGFALLPSVAEENEIVLSKQESMESEAFEISFLTERSMCISAGDALGFVYGLIYISREFLDVQPFWFWMDTLPEKREVIEIEIKEYKSVKPVVRYRGWFINDEVILSHWSVDGDEKKPWEMAFEALLRCGGNMVIPGTDNNSRKYRHMASDMGLYITHHHAEPLGAEMFARAYPDKNPSYDEYPQLFEQLWREGIEEQKDMNIIWNLGFRGQGDCPFWHTDPQYDTPKKRGELISSIIKKQYNILCEYFDDPVCCTNLYGEIMELYNEGYINIPDKIIKIWADNGFGKMVSRRQGNKNLRVEALPDKPGSHGIYYHASFYDLQAANHITMLPNSVDFVNSELHNAFNKGANDYLIVNCSNVRPHAFFLEAIKRIWHGEEIENEEMSYDFTKHYFDYIEAVEYCYEEYMDSMLLYGDHEDEHAGEQFYTYSVRSLAAQWMKDEKSNDVHMNWLTGEVSFAEQIKKVEEICMAGTEGMERLIKRCEEADSYLEGDKKQLFDATIYLHAKIHYYCLWGTLKFCKAYAEYESKKYMQAFYFAGEAAKMFEYVNEQMRASEYGIWKGYYANDCLADVKFTAEIIKGVMSKIRAYGDGPGYYSWQRQLCYSEDDRRVMLITNWENHMTDSEIFEAMQKSSTENK